MSRRLAAPIALVLWIAALSGVRAEAQTTFYEAYENGLAHEKAGAWQAARESFLKASALRPQAARRVKSYGLNFIDVYDPAIHLARAALRLGLLDEAARAVEVSRAAAVSPADDVAAVTAEIDAARGRAAPPVRTASVEAAIPLPRAESLAAAIPTHAPTAGVPPPVPSATPPASVTSAGAPPGERVVATRIAAAGRTPSARPVESPTATTSPGVAAGAAAPAAPGPAPAPTATAVATAGRSDAAPDSSSSSRTVVWIGAILAAAVTVVAVKAGLVWRDRHGAPPAPIAAAPEPSRGGAVEASVPSLALDPATAHTRVESRPLRSGTDPHFGAYVLEGVLGRGGMGTTYMARRTRDGFPVALKVPHEHILEQADFAERFLREGGLGAMLHHPNIVRIYEAGEHAGRAFIAMELLRGETLEQTLRSRGTLPVGEALHVARGIALALDYAHLKGIVHRDLKPENVMILPDGQVKVMDYGIARRMDLAGLTGTDTYLGTPSYSAPETITPVDVGPRADLYSLGIILYRMLSGTLPFTAATPFELLHKHAVEPLPPIAKDRQVPPEVFGLIQELTAKDTRERYASAELFLRDVDRILNRM